VEATENKLDVDQGECMRREAGTVNPTGGRELAGALGRGIGWGVAEDAVVERLGENGLACTREVPTMTDGAAEDASD
jgi:hypothetical protein